MRKSGRILFLCIVLIGLGLAIYNKFCEPYTIETLTSDYKFKQYQMFDENTGWAVTEDNEILYTESGHEGFYPVRTIEATNATTDNYIQANFMDASTAYVLYFSENGTKMIVEHTTNSGQSWHHSSISHKEYSNPHSAYIDMVDEKIGYVFYYGYPNATKSNRVLFKTENGGETFEGVADLSSELKGVPTGIAFTDEKIGYVATTNQGEDNFLYLTQDGAMTWKMDNVIEEDDDYNYMDLYAPVFFGENKKAGKIIFKQEKQGLEYVLMSTRDRGTLWIKEAVLDFEEIESYSFYDKKNGYIVDGEGIVHKINIKKLW